MSKFKVGDKVQYRKFNVKDCPIRTVSKVHGSDGISFEDLPYEVSSDGYELVEDAPSPAPAPAPKFKVGDKVQFRKTNCLELGAPIRTVTKVCDNGFINVAGVGATMPGDSYDLVEAAPPQVDGLLANPPAPLVWLMEQAKALGEPGFGPPHRFKDGRRFVVKTMLREVYGLKMITKTAVEHEFISI